ncbi:MAG TPA: hypothetical protein EYP88_00085 [Anaerolineales bacterium]|nr:hypothetical protein [Anaerolineales bacterium]
MLRIEIVFWMFVFVLASIGFVRGWAREILVTASVVLAYFTIFVLENYIPFVQGFFSPTESGFIPMSHFWFRLIILLLLLFFGYETPSLPRVSGNRFKRDNFRDSALGFFLGAINGYLILGSVWGFLAQAGYQPPFDKYIIPDFSQRAMELYAKLPPNWMMDAPLIYIAVILAFLFVIAVFV